MILLLRHSLDESSVEKLHKMACISPVRKGGSKFLLEQYRPVRLTSHVIRLFKSYLGTYIKTPNKQYICEGQHSFVPGKNTQTYLLAHYCL